MYDVIVFADTFSGKGNVVNEVNEATAPNQTVHNICASKPKPVVGLKPKPVWTNRIQPNKF